MRFLAIQKTTEEEKIEANIIINGLTVQFNLYGSENNKKK